MLANFCFASSHPVSILMGEVNDGVRNFGLVLPMRASKDGTLKVNEEGINLDDEGVLGKKTDVDALLLHEVRLA